MEVYRHFAFFTLETNRKGGSKANDFITELNLGNKVIIKKEILNVLRGQLKLVSSKNLNLVPPPDLGNQNPCQWWRDGIFSRWQWAEELKNEYSKIAKENQKCGQGGVLLSSTLTEATKMDSREKVAKDLDMSTGTLTKAQYIYNNASEENRFLELTWINCNEVEISLG